MTDTTTTTEDQLRRSLRQQGLALRKDRARSLSMHRQGGFMIVDPDNNWILAGQDFNLNLDDVAAWLSAPLYERRNWR
jgi:hypothetical protein